MTLKRSRPVWEGGVGVVDLPRRLASYLTSELGKAQYTAKGQPSKEGQSLLN
jgi:hypothetical protein